ncbi:hypothetical protein BDD12DRAFT_859050 [Trichophaea hybrida]|nr:hypothetical protein BDD12DRAFT_859050 [Trichophaea hybrida]
MLQKHGYLFQGVKTTWCTDHQALVLFKTTLADNPRRSHWRELMDQFNFTVKYKPGKHMHVDALTRHSSWPHSFKGEDPLFDPSRFG